MSFLKIKYLVAKKHLYFFSIIKNVFAESQKYIGIVVTIAQIHNSQTDKLQKTFLSKV